ncbi:MAG: hypothetical protein ACTSWL_00360 [Promethearchaeota archaeon]
MSFKLRIPDKSYPILKKLLSFNEKEKEILFEKYKSINASLDESYIDKVLTASDVPKNLKPVINEILNLFSVFNGLKEDLRLKDINEFIDMLKDSFYDKLQQKKENLEEDMKEKLNLLGDFIHKLFESNKSLLIIEKARTLLEEREKLVINTRIITDFRPVFEEDNIDIITDGVILHNLRIEIINEQRNKEKKIFALDHDDLLRLQKNISRAFEKEDRIRDKCKDMKIKILND